jgi:hypothetical protein
MKPRRHRAAPKDCRVRHKLHVDTAAQTAWNDLMLAAIGLDTPARRAAAKTTAYAMQRTFIDSEQSVIGSPVLDRHLDLLAPAQQQALTEGTPELITLATETGEALADDADNLLVGWN